MNIGNFLRLSSRFVSTTVHASAIGLSPGDDTEDIGDALRLVSGNYSTLSFPIIFVLRSGKEFSDLLDTRRAALFLISDRMRSVLEENHLTGWKTFPVRLLDKSENEIVGYHGLSITGRCGPIDVSKSEIIYKRRVPEGPICKFYKGLHVGLDVWDGTDFFLPKHYYGPSITSKAADIIKSNKLTNIKLTNLADIEIDELTAELIKSKQ